MYLRVLAPIRRSRDADAKAKSQRLVDTEVKGQKVRKLKGHLLDFYYLVS